MKKNKMVAITLLMVLILSNLSGVTALNESDGGQLTLEDIERIAMLEASAITTHQELIDAWTVEDDEVLYPDMFGGTYITDDYMLAVKLVDEDEELKAEIVSIVSNPNVLRFENTDISLLDLRKLNDTVSDLISDWDYISRCSYIDVKQSKIVIDLDVSDSASAQAIVPQSDLDSHIVVNTSIVSDVAQIPQLTFPVDLFEPLDIVIHIAAAVAVKCGSKINTDEPIMT